MAGNARTEKPCSVSSWHPDILLLPGAGKVRPAPYSTAAYTLKKDISYLLGYGLLFIWDCFCIWRSVNRNQSI